MCMFSLFSDSIAMSEKRMLVCRRGRFLAIIGERVHIDDECKIIIILALEV